MGTVYAFLQMVLKKLKPFFAGRWFLKKLKAFTAVDTLRRAGLNVQIVSVTPDEIVVGAHDVSVLCDINFENCDFLMPICCCCREECRGQLRSDKHEGLRKIDP